MDKYEAVAKTADEAIEEILSEMKVSIDDVDLEIEEASKGLLGFLKHRQVKVTATLKDGVEAKVQAQVKDEVKNKEPEQKEESNLEGKFEQNEEIEIEDSLYRPELINEAEEIVKMFMGQIASGINKNIEVNLKEEGNLVKIDVSGEDVSLLIGKHGKTLDALRTLLSLMINRGRGKDDLKRILLDVEGYRKKRDNTLERLARSTATKVIKTKKEVEMEPMNPYERRIIHSVLQKNKLVATRSEGEEPSRYVVVYPK